MFLYIVYSYFAEQRDDGSRWKNGGWGKPTPLLIF